MSRKTKNQIVDVKQSDLEDLILRFLISNGVDKFWAHTCMSHIRLASNSGFVTGYDPNQVRLTVDKSYHHVKRFSFVVRRRHPDFEMNDMVEMTYTFNPSKKKSHKFVAKSLGFLVDGKIVTPSEIKFAAKGIKRESSCKKN